MDMERENRQVSKTQKVERKNKEKKWNDKIKKEISFLKAEAKNYR